MRIRAGLSLGSPRSRGDGDLFGITLIEAARLCSLAPAGTALATEAIAVAAGHPLSFHGRLELKGFDDAVDAYRVEPTT